MTKVTWCISLTLLFVGAFSLFFTSPQDELVIGWAGAHLGSFLLILLGLISNPYIQSVLRRKLLFPDAFNIATAILLFLIYFETKTVLLNKIKENNAEILLQKKVSFLKEKELIVAKVLTLEKTGKYDDVFSIVEKYSDVIDQKNSELLEIRRRILKRIKTENKLAENFKRLEKSLYEENMLEKYNLNWLRFIDEKTFEGKWAFREKFAVLGCEKHRRFVILEKEIYGINGLSHKKYKTISENEQNGNLFDMITESGLLCEEQSRKEHVLLSLTRANRIELRNRVKIFIDKELTRTNNINEQFSAWDGSHRNLEDFIKEQLNDPGSYEHVKTVYWDNDDHLIVNLKYRARNGYGGVITEYVKAKVGLDGTLIGIIDYQSDV